MQPDSSFEEGHHYKPKAKKPASDQAAAKSDKITRPPPPHADRGHGGPGNKDKKKQVNRPAVTQPVEPRYSASVRGGAIVDVRLGATSHTLPPPVSFSVSVEGLFLQSAFLLVTKILTSRD